MDDHDEHREGLAHDLPRILTGAGPVRRRSLLGMFGAGGAALALAGCGDDRTGSAGTGGSGASSGSSSSAGASAQAGDEIPEETAGPYPGDGSNGPDALTSSGVVRRDITSSFGGADGVAQGVPLTFELRVFDASGDDVTPYAGAAIYLWHCTAEAATR